MLKFGIVTNINPTLAQARVQFADDDVLSYWLPILQQKTQKDKFYAIPDIGEHVACLMDTNSEEGVILGAIYSALDNPPTSSKNQLMIKFEDESFIQFNKETGILTLKFKGIEVISDINQTGKLQNSAGITSAADISDKTSSMQAMRDKYNPHTHTGNLGSPTSGPSEEMS